MIKTPQYGVMAAHKGSAWRALYFYVAGRQVLHFGVSPDSGVKPTFFGGVSLGPYEVRGRRWNGKSLNWRIQLPVIRWRYATRSKALMAAYRVQSRFWHQMDGRYGWGSKKS